MSLLTICEWLEGTWLGLLARESLYGFQILVAIHILALTLSVGTLVWFDLRLLGVSMPRCRVSELYRRLAPWMLTGFLIMISSGAVLFVGFATRAYGNFYFHVKLVGLLVAGVNALVFHRITERRIAHWDDRPQPPTAARFAGLISIVAWTIIIIAGRMMAYTLYN